MPEQWFYLESLPAAGEMIQLDERESHHATNVRRLRAGTEVTLFDGKGGLAEGTISQGGSGRDRSVAVEVRAAKMIPPPRPVIHLGVAMPAGHSIISSMLSMLVQVGMNELTPLRCEHGGGAAHEKSRTRWWRIMIEACKQSRRPHLPEIHESSTPARFTAREQEGNAAIIVAHPGGPSIVDTLRELAEVERISLLIGPEAGFTDEEMAAMESGGAQRAGLSDGILRIETAAIVAVAASVMIARNQTS